MSGYPPFRLVQPPPDVLLPVVLSSPHSGRLYPDDLVAELGVPPGALRALEDGPVDRIVEGACEAGATLIAAVLPRAYVDLNRNMSELDPELMLAPPPGLQTSAKVRAGLGVIPSKLAGRWLYDRPLTSTAVARRFHQGYRPYHEELGRLVEERRGRFGATLLIDCHSMPSAPHGERRVDIVLGDRFGRATHPDIVNAAHELLESVGLKVGRNRPYAGGFITEHYGRPADGVSALQIELCRSLFLNERTHEPLAGLGGLPELFSALVSELAAVLACCRPLTPGAAAIPDPEAGLLAAD